MEKDERRNVASLIAKKSRRLTLEELAAKGKRHVRVITASEAFQEIESVVDETSNRRANQIAEHDRAWVFAEAKEQFEKAAELRTESERLIREQRELARLEAERITALERKLQEELEAVRSSVKALEDKSAPGPTPTAPESGHVEKLFDELSRREESRRSEWEARLETTMSQTIDAVRRTVMAALKGTGETSVDATDLIVSRVLDDHAQELESNLPGIRVAESRVGRGVTTNLARLKALRKGTADPPSVEAATGPGEAARERPNATRGKDEGAVESRESEVGPDTRGRSGSRGKARKNKKRKTKKDRNKET